MPWPKALNKEAAITRWTTEPKGKRDGNAVTDEENGNRNSDEPKRAEYPGNNNADEKKCEPASGPDNEPRLSIQAPRRRLLDGVHEV
jgi:hypothetical protein